jgi:hypothetical protein
VHGSSLDYWLRDAERPSADRAGGIGIISSS